MIPMIVPNFSDCISIKLKKVINPEVFMMDEFDKSLTPHLLYGMLLLYYIPWATCLCITTAIYFYPRFISTGLSKIT